MLSHTGHVRCQLSSCMICEEVHKACILDACSKQGLAGMSQCLNGHAGCFNRVQAFDLAFMSGPQLQHSAMKLVF